MKKIKFTPLLITLFLFSSCWKDTLNSHCGNIVGAKSQYMAGPYYLHIKEPGKATLKKLEVSIGEYEYYNEGDTLKCK